MSRPILKTTGTDAAVQINENLNRKYGFVKVLRFTVPVLYRNSSFNITLGVEI